MSLIRFILFSFFILLIDACTSIVKDKEVTFAEDIAPIVFKNCSGCHNPNGAGPFNLLSYNDALKRNKLIAAVTRSGFMPPWPADNQLLSFCW